ncbi:11698_t:CDS:2, partial [Scutellospora calospora]
MSRFIYHLTLLLSVFLIFFESTSAQVTTLNTPSGSIAVGATVTITWVYTPQTNAIPGILSCIDSTTQNTTIISNTINLASQSYQWTVNVPAGTYYLALNDGSAQSAPAPAQAPAASQGPAQPQASAKSTSPSSAAPKSSSAPTTPTNAAASFTGSSISGYKLLFSLIVVAAVM